MPVMKNARHEAFAQALAKGITATDPYSTVGYKGDGTATSRLSTNGNIQQGSERPASLLVFCKGLHIDD